MPLILQHDMFAPHTLRISGESASASMIVPKELERMHAGTWAHVTTQVRASWCLIPFSSSHSFLALPLDVLAFTGFFLAIAEVVAALFELVE